MNDRPILFTPENAQKCHDGSKTQTRRTNGLQYVNEYPDDFELIAQHDGLYHFTREGTGVGGAVRCPYGTVGDRLWVREGLERHGSICRYRRDRKVIAPHHVWEWQRDTLSPIHMPKWACRTWLAITEIRVKRLQDISEEDAKAEGCEGHRASDGYDIDPFHDVDAREEYKLLWESIKGAGSWDANPWVWCLTFKRVQP